MAAACRCDTNLLEVSVERDDHFSQLEPHMRRLSVTLFIVALTGGAGWAHHDMFTAFDAHRRVTHTGTLSKLDWRNPHIFLFVDVKDEHGAVESWSFEGPPPRCFRNIGRAEFEKSLTRTVTIEASRARDGSRYGLLRQITLADGRIVEACP
jgi:hypothetical protein